MPTYDDDDELSPEELNERAIRDQLRVNELKALGDAELARRAKKNTERMLAEVTPGRQVCSYTRIEKGGRSMWADIEGDEEPKKHFVCKKPGVRMVAITGTWFCEDHDPLRFPPPAVRCMP